jgi:antitoxin VapB
MQRRHWFGRTHHCILIMNQSTSSDPVALQIANPVVVEKVERLAKATGLSKTAVVERAIDRLAVETQGSLDGGQQAARMSALLAQMDRVPDRPDAFDPLEWVEQGLPK